MACTMVYGRSGRSEKNLTSSVSSCKNFKPNIFDKSKCQNCFRTREAHQDLNDGDDQASKRAIIGGYLFVAPDIDFDNPVSKSRKWQRRYFVFFENGHLCYALDDSPTTLPQGTVNMYECVDILNAENRTGHDFSVGIVTPDKTTYIRAENREDKDRWMSVLGEYPAINRAASQAKKKKRGPYFPSSPQIEEAKEKKSSTAASHSSPLIQSSAGPAQEKPGQERPQPPAAANDLSSSGSKNNKELSAARDPAMSAGSAAKPQGSSSASRVLDKNLINARRGAGDLPATVQEEGGGDGGTPQTSGRKRGGDAPATPSSLPPSKRTAERRRHAKERKGRHTLDAGALSSSFAAPEKIIDSQNSSPKRRHSDPDVKSVEISLLASMEHFNLKKGWLVMQGIHEEEWKKYWFVLSGSKLKYYKDSKAEEDGKESDCIELELCLNVSEYNTTRNYGFQIQCHEKKITLAAMANGIRRNWIKSIGNVIPIRDNEEATTAAETGQASEGEKSQQKSPAEVPLAESGRKKEPPSNQAPAEPPVAQQQTVSCSSPTPKTPTPDPVAAAGQGGEGRATSTPKTEAKSAMPPLDGGGTLVIGITGTPPPDKRKMVLPSSSSSSKGLSTAERRSPVSLAAKIDTAVPGAAARERTLGNAKAEKRAESPRESPKGERENPAADQPVVAELSQTETDSPTNPLESSPQQLQSPQPILEPDSPVSLFGLESEDFSSRDTSLEQDEGEEGDLASLKLHNEKLKAELVAVRSFSEITKQQFLQLQKKLTASNEDLHRHRLEMSGLQAKLDMAAVELGESEEALAGARQQLELEEDKMVEYGEKLQAAMDSLEEELSAVRQELKRSESQLQERAGEVAQLKKKVGDSSIASREVGQLTARLEATRQKLRESEQDCVSNEERFAKRLARLQAKSQGEKEKLEARIAELEGRPPAGGDRPQDEELKAGRRRLKEMEEQAEELLHQLKNEKTERSKLQERYDEAEAKLADLMLGLQGDKLPPDILTASQLTQTEKQLQEALAEGQGERRQREELEERLRQAYQRLEEEAGLEAQRRNLEVENGELKDEIEEVLVKMSEVGGHFADREREVAELRELQAQLEEERNQLLTQQQQQQQQRRLASEEDGNESYFSAVESPVQAQSDSSLIMMQKAHQQALEELKLRHLREVEALKEDHQKALAKETEATFAALEAMQEAHRADLAKDRDRRESKPHKTMSQEIEKFKLEYEEEIDQLEKDMVILTEQYSRTCMENIRLKEEMAEVRLTLDDQHVQMQHQAAKNVEMNEELALQLQDLMESKSEAAGSTQIDIYELKIGLRIKESEIQLMKGEIDSLKEQLKRIREGDEEVFIEKYGDMSRKYEESRKRVEELERALDTPRPSSGGKGLQQRATTDRGRLVSEGALKAATATSAGGASGAAEKKPGAKKQKGVFMRTISSPALDGTSLAKLKKSFSETKIPPPKTTAVKSTAGAGEANKSKK